MRKEEFIEWRQHPVTQAAHSAVAKAVEIMAAELINKRESNPSEDQYMRGFIRGVQQLMDWLPEFEEGDTEDEI